MIAAHIIIETEVKSWKDTIKEAMEKYISKTEHKFV